MVLWNEAGQAAGLDSRQLRERATIRIQEREREQQAVQRGRFDQPGDGGAGCLDVARDARAGEGAGNPHLALGDGSLQADGGGGLEGGVEDRGAAVLRPGKAVRDPKGGDGSNLAWVREDLGGRSSPVVFQNRLYTIVRDKPATEEEAEKVVCVDAATGKTLWEHSFNMYLTDVPDERIGWSCPVVDPETGNVYVQGVSGYFCCLDGKTGKEIADALPADFVRTRAGLQVVHSVTAVAAWLLAVWSFYGDPLTGIRMVFTLLAFFLVIG